MKGTEIILAAFPKGVFLEGIVTGSGLYPGIKMQIAAGVAPVGGRMTWQPYNPGASNDPRLTAILDIDHPQGKTYADAYVSGTRGFLYCPAPGEEMNVLVEAEAGTGSANEFDIGDRLSPVKGTGQYALQSTSANRADFVAMEEITNTADVAGLVWCIFQGGN